MHLQYILVELQYPRYRVVWNSMTKRDIIHCKQIVGRAGKNMRVLKREAILEEVKRIVLSYLQDIDATVYLFGSWARGQERATSDIDVAVAYSVPLPRGTLSRIRMALEESNIPYRVEVVDLTHSDEGFRQKVKQEGIVWKG